MVTEIALPLSIFDETGGEDAAVWDFCGNFPLVAIANGRRACRFGWRGSNAINALADELTVRQTIDFLNDPCFPLLAVVSDGKTLTLDKEYPEGVYCASFDDCVQHMLADDWYLERPKIEAVSELSVVKALIE